MERVLDFSFVDWLSDIEPYLYVVLDVPVTNGSYPTLKKSYSAHCRMTNGFGRDWHEFRSGSTFPDLYCHLI